MKAALVVAVALSLFTPSLATAQSTVSDIYKQMADNAARAAKERADIYAKMVADAAALAAAAIPPPRVTEAPAYVSAPSVAAPPAVSKSELQYLQEALAYMKEQDDEKTAARLVDEAGEVTAPTADCGIKPIKPIPPIGCRDLVAQCVLDANGKPFWQWVCVK